MIYPPLAPCPVCAGTMCQILHYVEGYVAHCWECANETDFFENPDTCAKYWNAQVREDCPRCRRPVPATEGLILGPAGDYDRCEVCAEVRGYQESCHD